jgi:hypothetical protein
MYFSIRARRRNRWRDRHRSKEVTAYFSFRLPETTLIAMQRLRESMQQIQGRLNEILTPELMRAESLAETISQAAIGVLSPWLRLVSDEASERRAERIRVFAVGSAVNISIPGDFLRYLDQSLLRQPQKPAACDGCKHYHGNVYEGVPLICAMHPYGVEVDRCADFENSDRTGYYCDFCGEWHE